VGRTVSRVWLPVRRGLVRWRSSCKKLVCTKGCCTEQRKGPSLREGVRVQLAYAAASLQNKGLDYNYQARCAFITYRLRYRRQHGRVECDVPSLRTCWLRTPRERVQSRHNCSRRRKTNACPCYVGVFVRRGNCRCPCRSFMTLDYYKRPRGDS
jgi:hypothetical protein